MILLVIAMFLIVGVYVGYHASQQAGEGEEHNVIIELEIFNERSGVIQIYQNPELRKSML
ncbi:hypothetical protein [Nitrosopumilus oxyclinae]|uniref:hypothetical protein n=1 Tax=Nitrosopumilus oxyclinae TaxID=1959104 RepID=UPI001FE4D867|nr:hypothetical protein [Nitrosopumilus oxyclinae]